MNAESCACGDCRIDETESILRSESEDTSDEGFVMNPEQQSSAAKEAVERRIR